MCVIKFIVVFLFMTIITENNGARIKKRTEMSAEEEIDANNTEIELSNTNSSIMELTHITTSKPPTTKHDHTESAHVKIEATTETTYTSLVSLPCYDQHGSHDCQNKLKIRGKARCKNDFFYGRVKCCATCLKAWTNTTEEEAAYLNSTSWFDPCRDYTNQDGTTYTEWCINFALAKSTSNNQSETCSASSIIVKYRCMKTCRLC